MDRLKRLYKNYLNELLTEYKNKLEALPEWRLESYLSNSSSKSKIEKIKLIQNKFLSNDIIYSILIEDLEKLKIPNFNIKNLMILSIDDRFLEANGYSEDKKEKVYSFVLEVQKVVIEET